jgi:hypothetical protein
MGQQRHASARPLDLHYGGPRDVPDRPLANPSRNRRLALGGKTTMCHAELAALATGTSVVVSKWMFTTERARNKLARTYRDTTKES